MYKYWLKRERIFPNFKSNNALSTWIDGSVSLVTSFCSIVVETLSKPTSILKMNLCYCYCIKLGFKRNRKKTKRKTLLMMVQKGPCPPNLSAKICPFNLNWPVSRTSGMEVSIFTVIVEGLTLGKKNEQSESNNEVIFVVK